MAQHLERIESKEEKKLWIVTAIVELLRIEFSDLAVFVASFVFSSLSLFLSLSLCGSIDLLSDGGREKNGRPGKWNPHRRDRQRGRKEIA